MALNTLKRIVEDGIESGEIPEISELKTQMADLPKEEKTEIIQIIEAAMLNATAEAKLALQDLKNSIEVGPIEIEYSMEGLKSSIDDEKAKKLITMYETIIGEDLELLYGDSYSQLSNIGQETIKLSFWNILQSQFNISGGINIAKGKVANIGEMLSGLFGKTDTNAGESILSASLQQKGELLGGLKPEIEKDLKKALEVVESLIGKQANNLNALFKLTVNSTEEEKRQIFENPNILNALMNDGEYIGEGFNINLKENKLEIGQIDDIGTLQKTFINSISKSSNGLGNKIETIRSKVDGIEEMMKKYEMSDLATMKKALFGIPVIGVFFKMILGGFFDTFDNAKSMAAIDRIMDGFENQKHKTTVGNLRDKFVPGFLESDETKETPLAKVLYGDTKEFYKITPAFLTKLDTAGVDYNSEKFWEKILTGKGAGDNESIIYNKLKSTLNSADLDEEALIEAVESISVNDFSVAPNTQTASDAIQPAGNITIPTVATAAATLVSAPIDSQPAGVPDEINASSEEVTEEGLPSLEEQIISTVSLPAILKMENGEKMNISIGNDKKSIVLGEKRFSINIIPAFLKNVHPRVSVLNNIDFENGILTLSHAEGERKMRAIELSKTMDLILTAGEIKENILHEEGPKKGELKAILEILPV